VSGPSSEVVDEVRVDVSAGRVYAEGWQSWSPATWYPVGAPGLRPAEEWQHLMRFRPGTAVATDGIQGEGLLVVDPGTGEPARWYASTDPVAVPTLNATFDRGRVVVRSTGPVRVGAHDSAEAALAAYGDEVAGARLTAPPTVWCSWYRYFEQVTAADVLENLEAFDRHELAVDVVQVDDGWSPGLGEGLRESERFGSLQTVVDTIRAAGRRAGIWLAPFLVGAETTLAREHPDWLVGPAGRNWGQQLVGLDLTHPGVQELLADHVRWLVDLGISYLKLDFLYAGAVPGRRQADVEPVTAYRDGLALLRDAAGPDTYLVGCGAPLLPSVGLVDAMRVSPDTFHEGGEDGSTGLRGLMALTARAWQQGRLWVNDPDCVVARPSYTQRERWADAAREVGGLRSFSDRVAELDAWGLHAVRELMAAGGTAGVLTEDRVHVAARVAQGELATR
jgi:alpha-galactosidase